MFCQLKTFHMSLLVSSLPTPSPVIFGLNMLEVILPAACGAEADVSVVDISFFTVIM